MLKKVYEAFTKIQSTSGSTAKEQELKKYKGDKDILNALDFLLNSFVTTGISTKKMNKKIVLKGDFDYQPIQDFNHMLDYVKENNSGKDFTVHMIQEFANKQETPELQEFVKKMITKDLKLGISAKTINKVFGKGTIPVFDVMLAHEFEEHAHKVTGKFFITIKLDGNRCLAVREGDGVKFFTRKGKPVLDMTELEEQFLKLPSGYVYDGELLASKADTPSSELFSATQKATRKKGEKKDLDFHIFDMLPIAEFSEGKSKLTYQKRRAQLDILQQHVIGQKNIHILPVLYEGTNKEMITHFASWAIENEHEGVMINTANGLYTATRTANLLKYKEFDSGDLLVVSVEKAIDGEFVGLMGRVNVEFRGNLVGVGSGFKVAERREYIDNPDAIVGKIIEVRYFEETKDEKTGQPSMRFPTFKGIRYDKGIEDIRYSEKDE
ncbi:ATP-dependent DNA ligase [Bacillus phage vB_BanS_Skywalker]|uniref:DNA ligase n=2 Tax=Tsamsavirus TaxID=3044849 RepID=A0AAE8YV00_9CAUD|nr:ATP-dependent DNA ligase [Bacillus phage vB_BanS_Skywalker]YP_010681046.1 DNA ligase, ATP-dependent [Bacillus phage vB_BanS_MrDarsey]UGO47982.1 DNA ligase, ATP-dependent [Bacillus phage vB_BanS_MrDarsey]UGO51275.1 ATP-dependent DNA ligase [Bacillus phage vB_BanS_Skywalker]